MKPYAEVAVEFASALLRGDFEQAHRFLSRKLAEELSPEELREKYFEMFRGYTDETPARIQFDEEFCDEEWPAKQPGDLGWAYVGLLGDNVVEAVTPIVAVEDGRLVVREIDWGRP